jgi:hypothetical protein
MILTDCRFMLELGIDVNSYVGKPACKPEYGVI